MINTLNQASIRIAGVITIKIDDMSIRHLGLISGHIEIGDQSPCQNLSTLVNVGHFAQDQEATLDMNNVALIAETL